MASIGQEAINYEPPQTKNIAELEKIDILLPLIDGEGKDKDGEVFKYKYLEVEGEKYRVPGSVLGGIKAVLKKMPHVTHVTVDKEGMGMNTRYHVMPFVEAKVEKVE